jgi:hypothetical protein
MGLQGDDVMLTPAEMQEFEDFLATISYPPNPFRNFDNTLPTSLPLPGHYTTGRFAPAGQPLPNGNAATGLALYRPPNRLDNNAFDCVTCHTLPTGMGTDYRILGGSFQPIAPGPNGERHHMLVSLDGTTNVSTKVPHLRNIYEKTGFNLTQTLNTAGFGYLHDGSVDSIERFLAEPVFSVTSDQMIADLVAFMLAFSGSDLPQGSTNPSLGEPPGTASLDTHAAVGKQLTLRAPATPAEQAWITQVISFAVQNKVGLVVKGRQLGLHRGYSYVPASGTFQSDRAAQTVAPSTLWSIAAAGSELSFTVVPRASQTRIGIDRDLDGVFDRDELDAGTDPGDPGSHPGGCTDVMPVQPSGLVATTVGAAEIRLRWTDNSGNETGFSLERALAGSGAFAPLGSPAAGATSFTDATVQCGTAYDYRLSAYNCAGSSGFAFALGVAGDCCTGAVAYCTPKTNTLGCVPFVGASGAASATATSGFVITCSQVRNNKNGLLFYGFNGRTGVPFQGGTFCVQPPVVRSLLINSGGNPVPADDCSGVFSMDMNAFASGNLGGSPWPTLTVVGTVVDCQWWGRDPGAVGNTSLSNGLEYAVCP